MKRFYRWKRCLFTALALTLIFTGISPAVMAAEQDEHTETGRLPFQTTDSYVLLFGTGSGASDYAYFSPLVPKVAYNGREYDGYSILFGLKNTYTGEISEIAYCTDMPVDAVDADYRHLNLLNSTYAAAHADQLRNIVLSSYPHTSLEALQAASGIEELQMCEAITATQLAIWKTAHGDIIQITDFMSWLYNTGSNSDSGNWDKIQPEYDAYQNGTDAYKAGVKARIEALYRYLMALPGREAVSTVISAASFLDRSGEPIITGRADGTFDITVSATVDIPEGSDVTLTAYTGEGYWYAQTELTSGRNECTLTIEQVPARYAYDTVMLSIDGTQTVAEDVFLLDAKGIRGASQSMIAPLHGTMPVHASVKASPDRILELHKTAGGQPLANISFEVYYVGSVEDYREGKLDIGSAPSAADLSRYAQPERLVGSLTTDQNGNASLNFSTEDGVYLVRELPDDRVSDSVAFFVSLPDYSRTDEEGNVPAYTLSASPKNTLRIGGAKILKTDEGGAPLAGAVFQLYRKATAAEISAGSTVELTVGGTAYQMVQVSFYASPDLTGEQLTRLRVGADGTGTLYGLPCGTYYLVETEAPAGYNRLNEPVELTVNADSLSEGREITIINRTGTELPATGGGGTYGFTLGGLTLLALAAYLAVRKKAEGAV